MRRSLFVLLLVTLLPCAPAIADDRASLGYQATAKVAAETRLDWVFALANQSPKQPPADWLADYDSTAQTYERFVPQQYKGGKAALVLFISPGDRAMGWRNWQAVCQQQGILFAGPHNAGNNCPLRQRVRIVCDVLDDMRHKYNIDADRTYITGFSGGGRIACQIGFSLTELFGGVVPVCAGGELRRESWLRQRAQDRLSVALLTGETDFNRGEVARFRGPVLRDVGVRTRVWEVAGLGHGVPNARVLGEAFTWLEEGLADRRKFAKTHPAARTDDAPNREQRADRLLEEARERLSKPATLYSGLMQLKGLNTRWGDVPAARTALQILAEYDQRDQRPWEQEDIAEQRLFLIAYVRGLDAYASGPLPKQYAAQRSDMAKAAINLWQIVEQDGKDAAATAEAKRRIPELQKLVDES